MLRNGNGILLPELGGESSESPFQKPNCPKEADLQLECLDAREPEVAPGPLPDIS